MLHWQLYQKPRPSLIHSVILPDGVKEVTAFFAISNYRFWAALLQTRHGAIQFRMLVRTTLGIFGWGGRRLFASSIIRLGDGCPLLGWIWGKVKLLAPNFERQVWPAKDEGRSNAQNLEPFAPGIGRINSRDGGKCFAQYEESMVQGKFW